MDNCGALSGLFLLAMIVLLIVAVWMQSKRNAIKNKVLAEQAAREAEEKLRIYQDAWVAARASENIDALVRCGDYLVKATRNWQPQFLESVSWDVYKELLGRLKTQPGLKPTVLEMGRVAYAARRPDGALTIYDEQAIQNDILAHLG